MRILKYLPLVLDIANGLLELLERGHDLWF